MAVPPGFAEYNRDLFQVIDIEEEKLPSGVLKGWQWLFPKDWNVFHWNDKQNKADHPMNDYGVIIRRKHRSAPQQIRFMVAGFTEDGTVSAGEYLVKHWQDLWEQFVRKGHEDFVIVVPSNKKFWKEPVHISLKQSSVTKR